MSNSDAAAGAVQESSAWLSDAERVAAEIRARALELTLDRDGCYLSQALSSAEILGALYTKVLALAPAEDVTSPPFAGVPGPGGAGSPSGGRFHGPQSPDHDRFLISPAHYAVAIYAALVAVGRLEAEAFGSFNVDGSTLEMIGAEHSPGFELTTGSFGQAVSQSGGIAMGRRLQGHRGRVITFMSDGELEEGQTWEAIQALAFHRLDSVVIYVDVNGQQCDGWTKDVMQVEPIDERLRAFGASVSVVDGHDLSALADAAEAGEPGKPHVVLCYTNPAQGLEFLESRKPMLHYVRISDGSERTVAEHALKELQSTAGLHVEAVTS